MTGARSPQVERRRYPWTIGFVLVLGLVGAWVGWTLTVPIYRSTGLIHISASVPTPREPEARDVMPMLDAFIESQVAYLQSRRVIQKALEDPDWLKTGTNLDLGELKERLQVERKEGSQHFVPRFSHRQPEVAAAGVKAVIRAYLALAPKMNGETGEMTLKYLDQRVWSLSSEIEDLDRYVLDKVSEYGCQEGQQRRLRTLLQEVTRLERSCRDLDWEIRLEELEPDSQPAEPNRLLTPEEWALRDENVSDLIADRQAAEERTKDLERTLEKDAPALLKARKEIEKLTRIVDGYATALNDALKASGAKPGLSKHVCLKARRDLVEKQLGQLGKEVRRVGRDSSGVQAALTEKRVLVQQLRRTKDAHKQVKAELMGLGRVVVISEGDLPVTPHEDRRTLWAVGSGLAGIGLGVLLMLLSGLLHRRRKD
jgi:uncharacterized protein involved in exopolysaccharide biosynthesis